MQNSSYYENFDDNTSQVAGFVAKTFQLLNIPDFMKIVYWSSNGTQFTIKDVDKFEEIVLPKYFRHNKMNSFVRQLNMYGFHKTKHNNYKSTFKHPFFQQNREDLLPLVRRKLKQNNENQPKSQQLSSQVNKLNTPSEKQPQLTSVSLEKYFNFSNQFIGTTKMINMSLKKVSFNDFTTLQNLEQEQNEDCASIEGQLEQNEYYQEFNLEEFQNVSCFFSSKFNL